MKVEEIVGGAKDALSVKRVFGEPYERDGITIIPVAAFGGGAGGGGGEGPEPGVGGGSGGGFGLRAKPAGAYVIRNGAVEWRPALDVNRIISASAAVVIAFLFCVRGILRARSKTRAKIKR
jgi:uncharacterized spore protein YtfJ